MLIIKGDKQLSFTEEELKKMYFDEGKESIVYRYEDKILKLYRPVSQKFRLDESTASLLTKISTKRILLPEELLYDFFSCFQGYTTSFIEGVSLQKIEDMKMSSFVDNMDLFYDDAELLAENNVSIEDIIRCNLVYNKNIFVTDPGSFMITENDCHGWNQKKINEMIVCELFTPVSYQRDSIRNTKKMLDQISKIEEFQEGNFNHFIKDTMSEKESVKKYIKRMNQTWNT